MMDLKITDLLGRWADKNSNTSRLDEDIRNFSQFYPANTMRTFEALEQLGDFGKVEVAAYLQIPGVMQNLINGGEAGALADMLGRQPYFMQEKLMTYEIWKHFRLHTNEPSVHNFMSQRPPKEWCHERHTYAYRSIVRSHGLRYG